MFRDIHESERLETNESRALRSDWLEESIELVVTSGVRAELNQHPNSQERERLLGALVNYRSLPTDPSAARALRELVLANLSVGAAEQDPSLRSDSLLAAEAKVGGADAFVSRDQSAVEALSRSDALEPLWISTPSDLIVHLDELSDAANYAPSQLLDTGYSIGSVPSSSESDLHHLMSHSTGESKSQFRKQCRRSATLVGSSASRRVLRDRHGKIQGSLFSERRDDALEVSLIRAVDPRIARTMTIQMVHLLRQEARDHGLRLVQIADPSITTPVRAALRDSGFAEAEDGSLSCRVIDGCWTWSEISEAVLTGEAFGTLAGSSPAGVIAAEIERIFWPLKVTDSDLPCFMIPIRPAPAQELFGLTQTLFARDPELGLSRQHVYYRSPAPKVVSAPGRVLWYVSNDPKAVIASSRLDAVELAHPGTLHRKYRRLGVLDRTVIEGRAKEGRAQAILFSDTEFFREPVSLSRLRAIDENGHLEPLASPRKISAANFFSVYQEGRPR